MKKNHGRSKQMSYLKRRAIQQIATVAHPPASTKQLAKPAVN